MKPRSTYLNTWNARIVCFLVASVMLSGCGEAHKASKDQTVTIEDVVDYLESPDRDYFVDFAEARAADGRSYVSGTASGKSGVQGRFCFLPSADKRRWKTPSECEGLTESGCAGVIVFTDLGNQRPFKMTETVAMAFDLENIYRDRAPDSYCQV